MPSPITDPNARKWLDAIAYAEGTDRNLTGDNGYNVIFGGGTFKDLSRHPDRVISGGGYSSAAAGRYQFMPDTWKGTAAKLGLKDFGPAAQDLAAVQLMKQRGVDPYSAPFNPQNIAKLAPEWASLPTLAGKSYYGQPVVSFGKIQKAVETPRYNFPRQGEVSRFAGGQTTSEVPGQFKLPDFNLNGRIEQALVGNILNSAMSPAGNDQYLYNAIALNDAAAELANSENPDDQVKAEEYKSKAMSAMLSSSPAGLSPTDILNTVAKLKQQEVGYNENASQLEAFINSVRGTQGAQQAIQNAQTAAKLSQNAGAVSGLISAGSIATPGQDYASTGPHLHVAVLRDGQNIDPQSARSFLLSRILVEDKKTPLFSQTKDTWQSSAPITSPYGPRSAPTAGASSYHKGVDFGLGVGTRLSWAAKPGDVYTPEEMGTGVIKTTDPQGREYTVKLLHTNPAGPSSVAGSPQATQAQTSALSPVSADQQLLRLGQFLGDRIGKGLPVFG